MQLKSLHKNIYRLYAWARTQECLDVYRKEIEDSVRHWDALRTEGVSVVKCTSFVGIARATYYRRRARLLAFANGIAPPSKAPIKRNKPRWGEAERQLVMEVRRADETYGKAKIAVILRREKGVNISESTVGRILKYLIEKSRITRSRSAPRKRWRNFTKGHAKGWKYKDYKEMVVGERVQIDHMTATKDGVTCKHFQAWDRRSKHPRAGLFKCHCTPHQTVLARIYGNSPL